MPIHDATLSPLTDAGWRFDNTYSRLPACFYERLNPVPVRAPRMVIFNHDLAEALGLQPGVLAGEQGALWLGGNQPPDGAEPLAQAYAGHQFGHFTMLGDGRANLLGEHLTPQGQRFDIQLKGSGRTPFSRGGDGRAALGPMLREYIISEAMAALGIPTTRSLAVVSTGEPVYRNTVQPGAVLARVAASHIRVGTFAYAATWGKPEELQALADYTIQRHYPELSAQERPYAAFLEAVIERQAALAAQWMLVGFIHGVMNTDNMAISGESIDYGPCAFMDAYDPATVFSSIDAQGRYAYGNQPMMTQWNLARFAETLLPLLHPEPPEALALGKSAIARFTDRFQAHWRAGMNAKLGLFSQEAEDVALVEDLLGWMHQHGAYYTNTFRALGTGLGPVAGESGESGFPASSFSVSSQAEELFQDCGLFQDAGFLAWRSRWQARLGRQPQPPEAVLSLMQAHNPAVIPRNHRVEEALAAAVERNDFGVLEKLLRVLKTPYATLPEYADFYAPSQSATPYQTFCGT